MNPWHVPGWYWLLLAGVTLGLWSLLALAALWVQGVL